MISVIQTGGKQYIVTSGQVLAVERLDGEAGSKISFGEVLLTANEDGTDVKIGDPMVKGAEVKAEVVDQFRTKKLRVIKFKRKVRYRRVHGHRQHQTKVKIA